MECMGLINGDLGVLCGGNKVGSEVVVGTRYIGSFGVFKYLPFDVVLTETELRWNVWGLLMGIYVLTHSRGYWFEEWWPFGRDKVCHMLITYLHTYAITLHRRQLYCPSLLQDIPME